MPVQPQNDVGSMVRAEGSMVRAEETAAVDKAARCAAASARELAAASDEQLAAALRLTADRLDDASGTLVPTAEAETHLTGQRLTGELGRTTFQLRLFAQLLDSGGAHGVVIDRADPAWPMGPRPDLRRVLVPLGPVAVFAASNFPFAFSVAGGDTAAALAAGCPVIVKTHPGHPRLSELTGEIVSAALADAGLPDGCFALIHGEQAGAALVEHPMVKAVAFTGSLHGGRALFNLACARPEPIPFYGEFGSLNPVFVTRSAAAARREAIIAGFVASYTLGAGQFCTKPGLLFVPADAGFENGLTTAVSAVRPAHLLNDRITAGYEQVLAEVADTGGVQTLVAGLSSGDGYRPTLLAVPASRLIRGANELMVECFGPAAIVVPYSDTQELREIIEALPGQLTATVQGEDADPDAAELVALLTERAGRVIWNGWPTGVSVTWAQHHGGPYPATSSPLHTSVGTTSISRFLRPVVFQDMPQQLLPEILRD